MAWLLANKIVVYLTLGIILLLGLWYTVEHLKGIGVTQQQARDTQAQVAQVAHVNEVQADAQVRESHASTVFQLAMAAPVAPEFVLRVCPKPADRSGKLPANGGPGPRSEDSGGLPPGVARSDASDPDNIVPATELLLARANAKLAYWQAYYDNCHEAGICR